MSLDQNLPASAVPSKLSDGKVNNSSQLGIILAAHTRFDSPFVVGSHHLLRILRTHPGVSLLAMEPFAGWRNPPPRDRSPEIITPKLWFPLRSQNPACREKILDLNARLFRRELAVRIKNFPADRCVILDNPYAVETACWLQSKGFRFIMRLTDWMPGQIPSPDRETNFLMLRKALLKCDAAIVTSAPLARYVKLLSGKTASIVTNGVDAAFVAQTSSEKERSSSRVIYYGAMDARIDLSALRTLAERLPGLDFDFFTPSGSTLAANLPKNIHFKDGIRYEDLPRVLSRYAFGLLPFANCASNHGRFPMKLYEMIGSGVQVVAPPLSSFAGLKKTPGLLLSLGFGGDALADSLSTAQAQWLAWSKEARTNTVQLLRATAQRETWDRKAAEILELCRSRN